MNYKLFVKKNIYFSAVFIFWIFLYQSSSAQNSFLSLKSGVGKYDLVFSKVEDSLCKQFAAKKLTWPPQQIYIRSFKYDRMVEVWVRAKKGKQFQYFKTYRMCMQSGTIGPKRMEGDYQTPEGFYYINEFNTNSNYHLALGLNYPNASDKILSDARRPGSDIFLHGGCVSTGCIAINDQPIEELFVLASSARGNGQDFIPVHVFPVKYSEKRSFEYLAQVTKENPSLQQFAVTLKAAFDHFEEQKQLPLVMINKRGEYIVN